MCLYASFVPLLITYLNLINMHFVHKVYNHEMLIADVGVCIEMRLVCWVVCEQDQKGHHTAMLTSTVSSRIRESFCLIPFSRTSHLTKMQNQVLRESKPPKRYSPSVSIAVNNYHQ